MYLTDSIDTNALFLSIEPGASNSEKWRQDVVCKFISISDTADAPNQAAELHPYQTAKYPTLQKRMFLVAGSTDFKKTGLDLVDLEWDAETSGRTRTALKNIGISAQRHVLKVEASSTDMIVSAVMLFTTIARKGGYKRWEPKHLLLGAYYPVDDEGFRFRLASAIDPRWDRRGHGEHRVILGRPLGVKESTDKTRFWNSLVEAHFSMCRYLRFVPNFNREYFVCGDDEDPQSSVLIVKLDWQGDLGTQRSALEDYTNRLSVTRYPGGEAYSAVADLKTGKTSWDGSYVTF